MVIFVFFAVMLALFRQREVPVIPQDVTDSLAELAARAEALAAQIEMARA